MSSSNCCFLTCIQVSQEAGQVVWYSHLFQNFQQFIVIHTVKGFGIVNKTEIAVFLELSCFFDDPADIGNLISGSSAFSKTSLNIWKFTVQNQETDLGSIGVVLCHLITCEDVCNHHRRPDTELSRYHISNTGNHEFVPQLFV